MKKIELVIYTPDEKLPNDGDSVLFTTLHECFFDGLFCQNDDKPYILSDGLRYQIYEVVSWCKQPDLSI